MSTPIDDAIADLLNDLGPGWFVDKIQTVTMTATAFGGDAEDLPAAVTATIRHVDRGLSSTGEGGTVGNALARAVFRVVEQEQRMNAR